jgi:hypothetical protein
MKWSIPPEVTPRTALLGLLGSTLCIAAYLLVFGTHGRLSVYAVSKCSTVAVACIVVGIVT